MNFSHQSPAHSSPAASDLRPLAFRAMRNAGFDPDFSQAVSLETQALKKRFARAASGNRAAINGEVANGAASDDDASIRDLRSLLWSSIDNVESRDLDQVEWAERASDNAIRLLVGIADVDALVPRGSAIDLHAAANTSSVYTGVEVFPMLPLELSAALTSLLPHVDRLAIVVSLLVSVDGTVQTEEVFRARLRNRAKLSYEEIGTWLEDLSADMSTHAPESVADVPGLEEQLRLQNEAAGRLRGERVRLGALSFETVEARPVVVAGRVTGLALTSHNEARDLIESFMVAANGAIADYLHRKGSLAIGRVVREPDRWPRIVELAKSLQDTLPDEPDSRALSEFLERRKKADPAHFADVSLSVVKLLGPGQYEVERPDEVPSGHFGLAVRDYTHSTAPNRRYVDLVTQRLLKACISNAAAPYSEAELETIAARCMDRENAARKVERLMRKIASATLLSNRIGEVFDAIVTGASPKGVFVRLLSPPVEGRVMRGERDLDVGDKTRVRLVSTDAERGFIDFERA